MEISLLIKLLDHFHRGSLQQVTEGRTVLFTRILSPSRTLKKLVQAKEQKVLEFSMKIESVLKLKGT